MNNSNSILDFFDVLPFLSFLTLIGLLFGKVFYLKIKGINVSTGKRKARISKIIFVPFFGLIFFIWFYQLVQAAFQISFIILPEPLITKLFESYFLKILGMFFVFLSLVFFAVTLFHFKTSLRFGLDEKNQGELVTKGIFSVSRNPFFLSLEFYFLGISLLFFNLFFIVFFVLVVTGIHLFIIREEKFMHKVYGKEYENYCERVGRYIRFTIK